MMIRWQHQQNGIGVSVDGLQGSEGNSRGGVAPGGLQNDSTRLFPDFTKLFGNEKAVSFITHHYGRRGLNGRQTQLSLLQHGPGPGEG